MVLMDNVYFICLKFEAKINKNISMLTHLFSQWFNCGKNCACR